MLKTRLLHPEILQALAEQSRDLATKVVILDLDAKRAEAAIMPLIDAPAGSVSIRQKLTEFAEAEGLSL